MPKLPVVSMHAPPAVPDRLIALATRIADKILFLALRQLFFSSGENQAPAVEEFQRTVARLQRYTDPAILAAPDRLLAPPAELPRVRTIFRRPLHRGRREIGSEVHLAFASPYTPLDPEYAEEFAGYPEVAQAHVWSWRHREPAPASILLTHGWGVGAWWMHRFEFDVPRLFHELGLDVYFYLAPFHERRTPANAWLGGSLHPSACLLYTSPSPRDS